MHDEKKEHGENFVEVAVVTTSGTFPHEGFSKVPIHQKVRIFLAEAARELNITNYTDWIAMVDNREIDIEKNYEENRLSSQVEIDFGPHEGGGGNA